MWTLQKRVRTTLVAPARVDNHSVGLRRVQATTWRLHGQSTANVTENKKQVRMSLYIDYWFIILNHTVKTVVKECHVFTTYEEWLNQRRLINDWTFCNAALESQSHIPGGPKKWYLSYNVIYVREVSLFWSTLYQWYVSTQCRQARCGHIGYVYCLFVPLPISPPRMKPAASNFAYGGLSASKAGNLSFWRTLIPRKPKIGRICQRKDDECYTVGDSAAFNWSSS